jgi:hypothetical protein
MNTTTPARKKLMAEKQHRFKPLPIPPRHV